MFGLISSKSKPSPKSKGNHRRNKQDRNDQGRDGQGSNDQEWTEWDYSDLYKQEEQDRIGPAGNQEADWRQRQENLETEETEEYEESAEADSTKYVEIPRRLNPIQIPKKRQGDDEVQLHEYTHKGEPDTEGTSSQHLWATYQDQSVSPLNTPSSFQGGRPPWNPQSSPQGTRWPTVHGSQLNTSIWKPQPNFQASSMGACYGSSPGQIGYPGGLGSHTPLPTSQGGFRDTGSAYPWQQNQVAATGYGSAVNQPNLHSSSASRTVTAQSGWRFGSLPTINSGYPGGASGTGGPGQRGEDEEGYENEDEVDFGDQAHGEMETVPFTFSPPDRSSGRDTQLSQEYETTVKSMAGLAFTKESTQELERQVSTEEQSYVIEPSQALPGSPGRPGQPASYDPNDSQQGQYKQNKSRRRGYSRQLPILDDSFQIQKSILFKRLKVFKCLWSEPIGNPTKKYHSEGQSLPSIQEEFVTNAKYGETAYHGIRRFVIVKERKGHSLCVPILTYGSQGTNKPGVKVEYHAMIYIGQEVPSPLPGEQLVKRAVRMEPSSPEEKLDPKSRVNYAKVYTIEHNIRVCFIGKIHPDSRATFETDFKAIDSQDVNMS